MPVFSQKISFSFPHDKSSFISEQFMTVAFNLERTSYFHAVQVFYIKLVRYNLQVSLPRRFRNYLQTIDLCHA